MDVMYRKILVPVDSSEHSRRALQHAIAVARCQETHVALLHCLGRIPMLIGGEPREELLREMEREARKLLLPTPSACARRASNRPCSSRRGVRATA
jgi:nucleotide-binding universal stress UspA family protein